MVQMYITVFSSITKKIYYKYKFVYVFFSFNNKSTSNSQEIDAGLCKIFGKFKDVLL